MVRIKYIGVKSPFVGKTAWEILCNLKNLGVGRYLLRNSWKKFPEPSFLKVVKVEPMMDPKNSKGTFWCEEVYRSVRSPKPLAITEESSLPDFELVHKHDEKRLCTVDKERPIQVLPRTIPLPPLLKDSEKLGAELEIPAVYPSPPVPDDYHFKVAEKGEEPSTEFAWPRFQPDPNSPFYEGVKWTK